MSMDHFMCIVEPHAVYIIKDNITRLPSYDYTILPLCCQLLDLYNSPVTYGHKIHKNLYLVRR